MINSLETGTEIIVDRRFASVMKQLKAAIAEAELEIAAEFDLDSGLAARLDGNKYHLLLIDCPLTDFEALTADAAAAIFVPIHLLISRHDGQTRVCWANGAAMLRGRLPGGADAPLRRLGARIARALDTLADRIDRPNSGDRSGW